METEFLPQEIARANVTELKSKLGLLYNEFMEKASANYALWIHLTGPFLMAKLVYMELARRGLGADINLRAMIVRIENRMLSLPGSPPKEWIQN